MLQTRLTDKLGCKYPIVQTAMGWVADPNLVAGSCNAGGFGFLAGATIPPAEMERDILRVKELTSAPFGVNFHMYQPNAAAIVDMVIRHGVRAVSYSRSPGPEMIRKLKDAGVICMPTVGLPKHAIKAVELGADVVTVQGGEGGGHTGAVPTTLLIPQVVDAVGAKVPVVAAGGFKDGRGLVAALAWGADGIAMGTRFLVAEEVWAHRSYKERLVAAQETDTTLLLQSMRNTQRALKTGHVAMIQQLEKVEPVDTAAILPHIMGTVGRKAYETGDVEKAMLSCGQGVVFADRIEPVAAIVDRIEAEARAALTRLQHISTMTS